MLSEAEHTVSLSGSAKDLNGYHIRLVGEVSIPMYANNGSTSYSVTEIDYMAFFFCCDITSVKIPGSVKIIGELAFTECNSLSTIIALPQTPPAANYATFNGAPKNAVVYIPKGTTNAYSAADGWSYFTDFREVDDTSVVAPEANINNSPDEYFNLNGLRVNNKAMTPGLYIKRQGNKSEKIFVK